MDLTDYLQSKTVTVVKNPRYNRENYEPMLLPVYPHQSSYAKPNLQVDLENIVTPSPQHVQYHANIAGGPPLPGAGPSDYAHELAAYLGVNKLPSTQDLYNPQYSHMLDQIKKNPLLKKISREAHLPI